MDKFLVIKATFFIVFFQFSCLNTVSSQLDSLIEVVKTLPKGEEKVRTYLDIAFYLYNTDPQESLDYCQKGLTLSKQLNFDFGIGKAYYIQGACYDLLGESQKAIKFVEQGMTYFEKANKLAGITSCLNLKASIYTNIGWYGEAAEILLEVLDMNEKDADEIGAAYTMQSLGIVFENMEDFKNANKYLLKSLDIFIKNEAAGQVANTYVLLSNTIASPEQKWKYLNLGLKQAKSSKNSFFLSLVYINLGSYYYDQKEYQNAIEVTHKALAIAEESKIVQHLTFCYLNIGDYKQWMNELDSAVYYLEKGVDLAKEYQFKKELEEGYIFLTNLNKRKKNYERAFVYSELASNLSDTLYSEKINQEVQANTAKFEFEKNERKIAEQQLEIAKSKNARNKLLFISFVLIALIAGVYQWYLYRQNRKKQALEAESKRLKEIDQLKVNFFTNLAHELRTPLTLILSPLTDVLQSIKSKTEKNKLKVVQNNAKRLMILVNEVMDVSKVESGKLDIHLTAVPLVDFIKNIFATFESLAALRKINFGLQVNIEDQLLVQLDREKVEKIINNLLSNALKFTHAGGQVTLFLSQIKDKILIKIEDTGQGIHPEDQPYIFNRFYQAKHGNSALKGGTGVGLALSKELANCLDGTLTFDSKLNLGSSFTLELPLITAKATQKSVDTNNDTEEEIPFLPTYQPILINGEKPKILIVEDHLELSKYLVEILSDLFHCTTAIDGEEALKQIAKNNYDCITSDVMMPNMDGFELLEKINENLAWKQIPFLLLTARYLESDKIKGFQLGVDDYITKPFSTIELKARLHNLISNKLERDDFIKKNATVQEEEPPLSADHNLLKKIEQSVIDQLDNPAFSVDNLSKEVAYSASHLRRIIKKQTGFSTVGFILEIRLQKARELLEKGLFATVTEVQNEVGIQSMSYFTRKFTERFGVNPKQIRK